MSWMQKLFETYEACSLNPAYTEPPQAEDGSKETPALMPVSHTSQQAHIHVVIDGDGNFVRAELLPLKAQYVIPATEDSAGRTNGDAPHPLNDKIHYCAKDYSGFKKNLYNLYSAQLQSWCKSPHSHPKAKAVYAYISQGRLVHDLLQCGILRGESPNSLQTEPTEADKEHSNDSIFNRLQPKEIGNLTVRDQGDALIIWSVVNLHGDMEPRSWKDASLQRAWMNYDASMMEQKELCMVQGLNCVITTKHPRNIRRPGDGAKLISSNDSSNFTYRGRFLKPEQACTVGYEVSHKAHNALRWLIARQGYRNGKQAIVAWAVSGARVPNPCEDLFDMSDEEILRDTLPSEDTDSSNNAQPADAPVNMGVAFANRLNKALAGFKTDLKDTDGIAIMAMDAASPGRLSVTFYRELMLEQYLGNLQSWQRDFAWPLPKHNDKDKAHYGPWPQLSFYAPTPETIGRVILGRCGDKGDLTLDKKSRLAIIDRLLPCIVDKRPLPRDIVNSCLFRAMRHEKLKPEDAILVLSVACSMFKGYNSRLKKEEYSMALDRNRNTRDYLYGRLLGIARYIERTALDAAKETRPTNAEKLIQRFSNYPCDTWKQIIFQLTPYILRLQNSTNAGFLVHAQKYLDETYDLFLPEDFISSAKLSGEFLLGYHCQLTALYSSTKNSTPSDDANNEGA